MKSLVFLSLLLATTAYAQTSSTPNFVAAGVSWNQSATSQVAGTALYARALPGQTNTYSFTAFDAVPSSMSPFTVTTQMATGVAQRLVSFKGVNVYVPAAAGIAWSGTNTGWSWSSGVLASIPVKSYFLMPNVRVVKSSVNNNSGYQLVVGVMFGTSF